MTDRERDEKLRKMQEKLDELRMQRARELALMKLKLEKGAGDDTERTVYDSE